MGLKTEKEKNQNIQVVLRCRPLSATERKQGSYSIVDVQQDHHEVRVKERNVPNAQPRIFTFDKVFGPRAEQIDVYRTVMTPLIDEVLQGYNCTVFAYGQTGTGKTFTMEGEHTDSSTHTWESDPQAGIIPRAMHQLFTRLETQEVEFSVRVSYLEIYNEELVDLLGAEAVENPRLRIYEDISKKGSCVISGLEEMIVRSKDEVYDILNQGSRRRQTAATLMNAQSSRSHSLFMLTVHIKENNIEGEELLKIGKLNLVDLAGSECIGRSGATERRAREAGQINQSLLTLGRVITALVDHAPHVPYRESKLTRLLQDSLGGRTKTSIIATISPALSNLDETLSTLNYANTAKRITNRPEVNQKLTKRAMLKGYEEEIERLRRDLQATRDKHGVYIASENYEEMQNSIAQKTGIIKDLEEQLEIVTEIKTKLEAMFEETKEKLTITSEELKDTKQNLRVTRRDRDEQQFLVKEHVEKERDLHDEASRLLSTAEVSTDHVSRLHDKIDRKSSVEQHNEQATIQYEELLHADLSNMHKELQRMKDQYNSVTSNIQLTMGDIMDRRNQEVAVFTEDLMACKDRVVDGLTSIKSQLSAHQDQSNSWVEQHTKVTKQLLDEEISCHVEFVNQAFVSCIEKLHQRQQHHTDKIEELSQTLKRQMDLQTLYIEKHYTEVTEQLSAHKQKLDKFLSEHEKRLQTVTDETQAMCEEQSDIIKCLAQLSTRIDKQAVSMEKMVTKNQNIVTNVQEYHTESMVDCDQTASELNTMTGGMTGQIKLHHEERNTLINDLLNDTFTDDINTTKTKMTDFSETAKLRLQEDCTQLTAAIDQHKEHVAAITDIVDQNQAITTSVASDVDRVSAYNKDQHTKATVAISQELEAMDKERCAVNDWCAQYKQTISHVEQLSTKYTGQDLRQDMPTGETPQRQDYTFPRTLTKTGRHSTLLKAFRREYMVEDALQEPIPQDSFTEEFPEEQTECTMAPPPFDFEATRAAAAIEDCGESTEYAVDNTDTRSLMSDDSAISSQSRTSALSAKDNVHKENVYQRSASKNVRSVTKNGPNSNGTPTKRGGDGPRANSTKKATAASGQTSKAKQRLPLRSNNP